MNTLGLYTLSLETHNRNPSGHEKSYYYANKSYNCWVVTLIQGDTVMKIFVACT
jgi:hypothetical protein